MIADDDGYFFCEILDLETGQNFWNTTDVLVYGKWYDTHHQELKKIHDYTLINVIILQTQMVK